MNKVLLDGEQVLMSVGLSYAFMYLVAVNEQIRIIGAKLIKFTKTNSSQCITF